MRRMASRMACGIASCMTWIALTTTASAQVQGQGFTQWPDPTQEQTYTWHLASSQETTGANTDYRTVTPGQTLTLLDEDGPGMI